MKKLITILLLIAFPAPALADLKYVPKWTMMNDHACYDKQGAVTLLQVDDKLDQCVEASQLHLVQIQDLTLAVESLKSSLAVADKELLVYQDRTNDLDSKLRSAIAEREQARAHDESSVAWTVAGAVALLSVGLAGGFYLSAHPLHF
jgi:hypothetical protein